LGLVVAERPRIRPAYVLAWGLGWPLLRVIFRLRATGLENLPKEGGFVLAANHESNLDPWPLAIPLFPDRAVCYMAKEELFNAIIGPPLRAAGVFPVDRASTGEEALALGVRLLRAGEVIGMFPEGTRARKGRSKKGRRRARPGAARIALEAGVPLVPAAIEGTDRLLRFGRVRVAYGRPIAVEDLGELDMRRASVAATKRLMEAIAELRRSL
jgi:1-acyl-sn-glycerol-3-phosphate acyltransferase